MLADLSTRIEALSASTRALLHTIADTTDDQLREPSLLPRWTRGHVLSHLARNADALVNLTVWARTGVETPAYASREARDAEIEAGSGRSATELRADIEQSHQRLMEAFAALDDDAWQATLRWGSRGREALATTLPFARRAEVEVHHVDLNLGYTIAHWPEDMIEALLDDAVADYAQRDDVTGCVLVGNDDEGRWVIDGGGQEVFGPPPALLGWLIGRTDGIGLHTESGTLPEMGAWR